MDEICKCLEPYRGFLPVFLTALLGLLTYGLGRYNSKTERLKLRLELHDRRMKIFRETMEFLTDVYGNKNLDWPRLMRFRETTNESYFLLGKDINTFLLQINSKAAQLDAAIKDKDDHQINDLRKWICDQCETVFTIFSKHMSLVE